MSDIEKVGEPRIIPDPDAIHVEPVFRTTPPKNTRWGGVAWTTPPHPPFFGWSTGWSTRQDPLTEVAEGLANKEKNVNRVA